MKEKAKDDGSFGTTPKDENPQVAHEKDKMKVTEVTQEEKEKRCANSER